MIIHHVYGKMKDVMNLVLHLKVVIDLLKMIVLHHVYGIIQDVIILLVK